MTYIVRLSCLHVMWSSKRLPAGTRVTCPDRSCKDPVTVMESEEWPQ